jgi:nucleoid DNA-binding protein
MNKQDIITKMAELVVDGTGTKAGAEKYLTAFQNVVMDAVARGNYVKIVGFGTFEKKATKGSEGTIQFGDRKGQKWKTEDSFKPVFNASRIFKEKVKG